MFTLSRRIASLMQQLSLSNYQHIYLALCQLPVSGYRTQDWCVLNRVKD